MRTLELATLCIAAAAAVPVPAASPAPSAEAQPLPATLTFSEVSAIVLGLAESLERDFVFPDVGVAYGKMLRQKLAAGAYPGDVARDAFAESLTADLQALHADGHLRVYPPKVPGKKSKYRTEPDPAKAIGRSGWVADGVAYIALTVFPGDQGTLDRLRAFLDSHASARTLILDLRVHHGGDVREADLIASYLYAKDAEFAHMDTRASVDAAGRGAFDDGPTMRRVDGPTGVVRRAHIVAAGRATPLRQAKVLVLTSRRTASAGEALAMGLKRTGRATLIGETTMGAGHFGDPVALPHGFSVFVPSGRTFDPSTGTGWEGTGIAPHVVVAPDMALSAALTLAGVPASAGDPLARLQAAGGQALGR